MKEQIKSYVEGKVSKKKQEGNLPIHLISMADANCRVDWPWLNVSGRNAQ